ncbi:MAG: transposase [Pseudomonadota bacterium]
MTLQAWDACAHASRTIEQSHCAGASGCHDLFTMSCYRRAHQGNCYFFTVVTYQRRMILCDDPIRLALHRAINTVRANRPFSIDAWVLLPDHLHCIWTLPVDDQDYSIRWSRIKGLVVRDCPQYAVQSPQTRKRRRDSTIWQRRFWEHQIRNDRDFAAHMDYIHYNPVHHGQVTEAVDWPFSTLQRLVASGHYPPAWAAAPAIVDLNFE